MRNKMSVALTVVGAVLLAVAVVLGLSGHVTAAVVAGVAGLFALLVALFRRRARPGDYSRSGAAGL